MRVYLTAGFIALVTIVGTVGFVLMKNIAPLLQVAFIA